MNIIQKKIHNIGVVTYKDINRRIVMIDSDSYFLKDKGLSFTISIYVSDINNVITNANKDSALDIDIYRIYIGHNALVDIHNIYTVCISLNDNI